jgi:hypothetical protein
MKLIKLKKALEDFLEKGLTVVLLSFITNIIRRVLLVCGGCDWSLLLLVLFPI